MKIPVNCAFPIKVEPRLSSLSGLSGICRGLSGNCWGSVGLTVLTVVRILSEGCRGAVAV